MLIAARNGFVVSSRIDTVAICESATPFTDLCDVLPRFKNNIDLARKTLVYQGQDANDKPIGILIPDTWMASNGTTVYDDPIMCVDCKMYEDENGVQHLGAKLQRVYACAESVQFDAAEDAIMCDGTTETTASANMGYYGWAANYSDAGVSYTTSSYVNYNGTAYKCKSAYTSSSGDLTPDQDTTHWQVQSTVVKSALVLLNLTTGDALPYADYLSIHKNTLKDSTRNIFTYGDNNWGRSANRQYYNSTAGKGSWWTSTHIGDAAPSQLNSVRGYMAGCSPNLLAALSNGNGGYKKVMVYCGGNDNTDNGIASRVADTFFLSSLTEMYGATMTDDGTADIYWAWAAKKQNGGVDVNPSNDQVILNGLRSTKSVTNKNGSATYVRLRSSNRYDSYVTWLLYQSGRITTAYNQASGGNVGAPACVIYK